jgi:hypothetical protein
MMAKDLIVALGSFIMVAIARIGVFNRCWCIASIVAPRAVDHPVYIDLGPVSQEMRDYNWSIWLFVLERVSIASCCIWEPRTSDG